MSAGGDLAPDDAVRAHYARGGLLEAILEAARAGGADLDALTPVDLAPVDEFHTAGRRTTAMLLERMPLEPGMHVLDVGSGIGGTARHLAVEHGARVTGIDLTPEYVATARALTGRLGLDDHCRFDCGDATDLPYDAAAFDACVSLHAAMNIAARDRLYAEMARVVRPGAPLGIFDVMKGPSPGMRYPVPWAEGSELSVLETREQTLDRLSAAGFEPVSEENLRGLALTFFREALAPGAAPPGPLGLHLLTGASSREKFSNYLEALEAHQIEPVILVGVRR